MKSKIGLFIHLVIFLGVFGFFVSKALVKYFSIDLGDQPIEVSAIVTNVEQRTRVKKGRRIISYFVSFSFPYEGENKNGSMTMSNDAYGEIVENNKFDLVYEKGNPSNYKSKWSHDKKFTIARLLFSFVFGFIIAIVATGIVGGILNKIFKFFPDEEK